MALKPHSIVKLLWRTPVKLTGVVLIVALSCLPLTADESENEQKKLKAVEQKITKLQSELQSHSQREKNENVALQKIEIQAGTLNEQIRVTETDLSRLQKELKRLNRKRDSLNKSKVAQQDLIAQHINTAFRMGREEQIKLLLNEEDPTRLNRMLKYHAYFLQARADKIETYLTTLKELEQLEAVIANNEVTLHAQRKNLQTQQNALKKQIAKRQSTLQTIKQRISSDKSQLQKMNRERHVLEQIITTLKEAIANLAPTLPQKPFATQKGKLSWPVKGRIIHNFGTIRKADIRWNGILLRAAEGTAVQAIYRGRVIFSDYLRGHGLLLIIDHGDGFMSLYAHNQILLKESGDWVSSDELISRVGNSGGLETSVLYFEIRHNGKPSNPKKWLKRG
jgi:septal ring factor EnvC (AmiA/AmiB activator)